MNAETYTGLRLAQHRQQELVRTAELIRAQRERAEAHAQTHAQVAVSASLRPTRPGWRLRLLALVRAVRVAFAG